MAKAWNIDGLNYEENLIISLSKVLTARFNEMISYEVGTLIGDDIEFLHSMRVSSRRLQAVMKVFRNAYPPQKFDEQYEMVKTMKNYLGEVRHYDVFVTMLEKYRNKLNEKERKALDLMIIRQNTIRTKKRREMTALIKDLNKNKYKDSFLNFTRHLVLKNEKKIHSKAKENIPGEPENSDTGNL